MMPAPLPINESQRQEALARYRVLDTLTEQAYDELTALAAEICDTPIALISLIDKDRQWFKSHHGLDATETSRDIAFCAHAILQEDFFEIPDSRLDSRFHDNPLVTDLPHVIYYCGAVLKDADGYNLGTLCVIDNKPRELDKRQKRCLKIISKQVISLLHLRKALQEKLELNKANEKSKHWIERRQQEMARFAYRSSHDLRAPAIQICNLAELIKEDLLNERDEEARVNSGRLMEISQQLLAFIDGVVEIGRADLLDDVQHDIDFARLLAESVAQVNAILPQHSVDIRIDIATGISLRSEYIRIRQMLVHLLRNAVMYANPNRDEQHATVKIERSGNGITMSVADNGIGIAAEHLPHYFDLFSRFHPQLCPGSGVGTTIVGRHAHTIGALVDIESNEDGTTVFVHFPQDNQEAVNG